MKIALLLALTIGLLAYALAPQWRSLDGMGQARFETLKRSRQELLVGVCWPFSVNADGMADGLQLALDEINSGRLTGGPPIRLILRDDAFDWEKAKSISLEFAGNPAMSAVLGYYDDSVAIKASTVYESSRLLHLIIGANNTAMTRRGFDYIVRTTVSSEKIANSMAKMLVARGHKKFALVWEEDAYGEDLAYQFNVSLNTLNARLVYEWSYSRDRADFRLPVNELKGTDADVIFFAGIEPWAGDFLHEARRVGVKKDIVGAFSDTPEMRQHAGPAIEGSMYFEMYNPASESPQNRAFAQKFRMRFGKAPDTWAAQGYDALHLLAKAVQSTASVNPLDLTYALRFMAPWEGANGRYHFTDRGELDDKPIYLNVFKNSVPVTIQESMPAPTALLR